MVKTLVIAPQFDLPTTISTSAVIELLTWMVQHNYPVDVLYSLAATRSIVESQINNYDFICYFGHGSENALIGEDIIADLFFGKAMLDLVNAPKVQKPKIIYTMACLSGLELGPFIGKQNIAYFGHRMEYFAAFDDPTHAYYEDWADYITFIPKQILQGVSCQDALDQYRAKLTGYINNYNTNQWAGWDWYVDITAKNRDFMTLFGPNVQLS
jgi:hypothetical protein